MTVAHSELSASQTEDNVNAAVERISANLPGGAANIRNIHIKTEDSPALPIYVSMGELWLVAIVGGKFGVKHVELFQHIEGK